MEVNGFSISKPNIPVHEFEVYHFCSLHPLTYRYVIEQKSPLKLLLYINRKISFLQRFCGPFYLGLCKDEFLKSVCKTDYNFDNFMIVVYMVKLSIKYKEKSDNKFNN